MAKDKKKGAAVDAKKAKKAEKKQKQEKKGEKKSKTKTAKLEGSDAEDVDLDNILEEYRKQQEQFLKVTEVVADAPPKPRSSSTFLASPSDGNQLLLFGGENYNGAIATFYNDLSIYYTDRHEWHTVTSPNAPLPRSGHAWCRGGNQSNSVFLFGGEFSSPKQGTFYHYNDFWRLEPRSREWTRIECKGKTPPARSGHRMTYYKNYIILFGGFQDTSNQTKYLADLWLYDTANFVWYNPVLPQAQLKPDARSSFTFLPHDSGAVLFGGYSRVKTTVSANKSAKGASQGQRNILKPMIHQDCFLLRITQPPPEAPANTPPIVRWERRKKPANTPNPSRVGATMAYHKGRGIFFGGVHDVEESEEGMDSEFFNQMFAWNVERNRFFPLALRKPRVQKKQAEQRGGGGRRGRAQANEEELLKQLAALQAGQSLEDVDGMEIDLKKDEPEEPEKPVKEMPVAMEFPHPRFNAQLAIQDDMLYIYGGTFEKDDREFTFDDLYAINLDKMDGCKEVFNREEDDEDERPDEDQIRSPSNRKKPQADESNADTASTAGTETTEENEADTVASSVDDGLPHPRPFESRREFFTRTSNEWQEILMTSLRWKNIQPETLSIKEIKTKAFELSEEKWWDCREEITALEDEQEAAGIGEVVSLADKGEGAAGGAGRRRQPRMPIGIQRLNAKKSQPNTQIIFIKPLKGPYESVAQDFLERIAAQCLPIMREHHISVMSLEEYEPNKEFVGRNFNAGEIIQLVLKSRSGRWFPFNYVQMVMMHELAHCKQMNHSRAFWAVRNNYAEHMRRLWSQGYTGEGLWGRGALLTTGEFESNTVHAGEVLPEHLCGGTYRSRRRKRKAKDQLNYQQQKERRILKKFGANGVALGEDEVIKAELENGKRSQAKPRVAQSKRGRELRAAAALARFDHQKKSQEDIKCEVKIKDEDDAASDIGSATASESEADTNEATDINGARILDGKGHRMVKVCEDENPEDADAQNEILELQSSMNVSQQLSVSSESEAETRTDGNTGEKQFRLGHTSQNESSHEPTSREISRIAYTTDVASSSVASAGVCPLCSMKNGPVSLVCIMCSHVLDCRKDPQAWKCTSASCRGSQYLNASDAGLCGICGGRKPISR
ncbi:WLM domain-containing protein [Truncatella angustata]|uniref:WLM domain-containing protein n=1 Tax=Truncatella angustata TaxID=152316 RepID=A0A9P9A212_9PEZI|nr:WLM domain-containing protein [Truncatella angustata]KAH6660181.1 WLM domain-containing protein [Truncatella angustata]